VLVPPRDEVALAEALSRLLGDAAERERLGANGRRAAEQYSWERVAGRVLTYYKEVREGQRTPDTGLDLLTVGHQPSAWSQG
jgi:glycosyltransferase involved in cell wall biosynthesis